MSYSIKILALFTFVSYFFLSVLYASSPPPAQTEGSSQAASNVDAVPEPNLPGKIVNGWYHSSRGFKVPIPTGYDVVERASGVSVMFRAQKETSERLKPYIAVTVRKGGVFMDDESLNDENSLINGEKIKSSYKKSLPDLTHEYEIISQTIQTLPSKRQVMLIYCMFGVSNHQMMQAHMIFSDMEHHYILTFTDGRTTFEQNFENLYNELVMFSFEGETPIRKGMGTMALYYGVPGGVILLLLIWLIAGRKDSLQGLDDDMSMGAVQGDFSGDVDLEKNLGDIAGTDPMGGLSKGGKEDSSSPKDYDLDGFDDLG